MVRCCFAIILFFSQHSAWAGSLLISYDKILPPSQDLLYQGQVIDVDTAAQLKKNGFDLSTLNPAESDVWFNQRFSFTNEDELDFPREETPTLIFDSVKAASALVVKEDPRKRTSAYSQGLFLARVINNNKPYRLALSLNLHPTLMRAAALRLSLIHI